LHDREKILIKRFYDFPSVVAQAAEGYNPALLANYTFDLVKEYNQFYHDVSILKAEEADMVAFRLMLSEVTASLIRRAMGLLGIRVPDKM